MSRLLAIACLAILAAGASSPPKRPSPGDSVAAARAKVKADDLPGALVDAEAAVANGGGAPALAARADIKRAMGRPIAEAIVDYAAAAKLDSSYQEKYEGLIAQRNTGLNATKALKAPEYGVADVPLRVVKMIGAAGMLLLLGAWLVLRRGKGGPPPAF